MSKINCVMGSAEVETKDGAVSFANYARCEWKCIAFIGTDDWGNFATQQSVETLHATSAQQPKPVSVNAMHCSGQRGDNKIKDDPRRPPNQVEGRLIINARMHIIRH